MNELKLIKPERFGEIQCDFYGDGKEPWMTRDQIGAALEYSNPRVAIAKIHARKKARLDKYSVVTKLVSPDGKTYDTTVYNRKGVMEICRHSDQPQADAFMDFCWETMDGLMSGKTHRNDRVSADDGKDPRRKCPYPKGPNSDQVSRQVRGHHLSAGAERPRHQGTNRGLPSPTPEVGGQNLQRDGDWRHSRHHRQ